MARLRSDVNVFINVPFDLKYLNLFVALIAGLAAHGTRPRSVLEVPAGPDRLTRLFSLLQKCEVSLHDLSRVQLSGGVPRFNMPFEAGLATALMLGRHHERFLMEEVDHRLQRSLSDLNGTDPYIHHGTVVGMLGVVSDIFSRRERPLEVVDLRPLYTTVRRYARDRQADNVFRPAAFRGLVLAAQAAARRVL